MKPHRSLSLIVASALCALAVLFAAPAAEASVGVLKTSGKVLKNKQTARTGDEVNNGDVIETDAKTTAVVVLDRGGQVIIRKMTRVRIFDSEGQPMEFAVVFGGIDLKGFEGRSPSEFPAGWAGDGGPGGADGDAGDGAGPLPYLASFGFGNFSFPSIGGGSAPTSKIVSKVLSNGQVSFFDELGRQVVLSQSDAVALGLLQEVPQT